MKDEKQTLCVDYSRHLDKCECITDVLHILVRAHSQWISVGSDVSLSFAPGEKIAHLVIKGASTEIVTLVIEILNADPEIYHLSEEEECKKAPT